MNKYKYLTFIFSVILIVLVLSGCFLLPKPTLIKPQLLSPTNGATNVSTTATLTWKPSNVSQTTYEVFLGKSASNTAYIATTGQTSFVVNNLSYSTTYYWKVVSMANDQTATSDTWSFTTVKAPAPSKPFLSITGVSTSSVALGWTQSIGASMVTLYGSTSTVFNQYAILSGSSTSYMVNNLTPSTVYKFFVVAINPSGRATSNTVTATTLSYTPVIPVLPVIKSFGVTSVSTDTITLGFQTQNASVIYIYNPPSALLATLSGNATFYTITGLKPSTSYSYFIVGINPSGRATSNTVTAVTQSYVPTTSFPIYIGDKPVSPSLIQHLYVTLTGFSIHATFEGTSEWYTSSASGTCDLTTLVGTSTKFTNITLPASAIITQIRFEVSSATIVINGNSYPLNIPSSTIYMNMNSINALESGGVYFDFDISQSVEQTGQGYLFKPVIHSVMGNVRSSVIGQVMYNSMPVPMAVVSLSNSSTVVAETYTKPNGKFMISAVQTGNYTLTISASGLTSYSTSVTLSKGMNNIGTINLSILPPATPVLRISTPNPYLAVLTWTQSAQNASGFHVWESTSPMQAYTQIATLPGSATYYNASIRPAVNYYFMVSAYNSSGHAWSNIVATKTTLTNNIVLKITMLATIGISTTQTSTNATITVYATVGNTEGGNRIESVVIKNQPATRQSANVWTARVPLSAGSNTIEATATDLYGNTISTSTPIYVDNATPTIEVTLTGGTGKTISPYTLTNNSSVTIYTNSTKVPPVSGSIIITDNSKMPVTAKATEITNVSTALKFTTTSDASEATFNATSSQRYTIKVFATDAFGHTSTYIATFTLVVDTVSPTIKITAPATVGSGQRFTATVTATDLQSEIISTVATHYGVTLTDPTITPISNGYEFTFTLTAPKVNTSEYTYITAKVEENAGNTQMISIPVYVDGQAPVIEVNLAGGNAGSTTLADGSNITIQSVKKLKGSISITDDSGLPITAYATEITTSSAGLLFTGLRELNSTFDASYYYVTYTVKVSATDPFGNKSTYLVTFTIIPVTIGVGSNPMGVGVDPITHMVYVANYGSNTVSVIDGNNINALPKTISVENHPYVVGISSSTNGSTIYVSNGNNAISVINSQKNYVVRNVIVGNNPVGIGIHSIMNMIYVANYGSNTVSVINGRTNSVIQNINVGKYPRDVGIDTTTGMVYVTNYGSNTISVISGKTNSVIQTIPVGKMPRNIGVNPATGMIYISNSGINTISVINGNDLNASKSINVGDSPWGVGVDPARDIIYVVNSGSNTVSVIDGKTNSVIQTIPVGKWPRNVGVDTATGMIYVTNFGDNTISAINGNMILDR
ncbi:DUF4382 domain-containing protein [Athalassotoga saccharophila]|uniref:DUF4382 domain-containing protein n=1 Tax=Athalassotoga saccharophila TaxID=1441386 RepID=UPI00137A1FAB|nr:DUF4382 domain-containing protein [Athalassotoga saccharophila]BBJ28299.1 PE-PGRS family protein PE_PGRS18 [Athalassotoga saccharophila]